MNAEIHFENPMHIEHTVEPSYSNQLIIYFILKAVEEDNGRGSKLGSREPVLVFHGQDEGEDGIKIQAPLEQRW